MFKTKRTTDLSVVKHKLLIAAFHGYGKTTQAKYLQEYFGKVLVIDMESGVQSLTDTGIDVVTVTSWDGKSDPDNARYSFKGLMEAMRTKDFADAGYKCLFIDSLTELSDLLMIHIEKEHEGTKNGFQLWGDYARVMVSSLKWLRNLPYHVTVTCLLAEETDDNGAVTYQPLVKGSKVSKHIPAIFDHVWCGVRSTSSGEGGEAIVRRFLITDNVRGYFGKARDPYRSLKAVEETGNVTDLFKKMSKAHNTQKST
jgi:hypothetical protein